MSLPSIPYASKRIFSFLILAIFSSYGLLQAGDWPQILGPNRNGTAIDEIAPRKLSSRQPPLWSKELGAGYAGPVVAGDRVIAFHRTKSEEIVEAFATRDGASLWKSRHEATYRSSIDPDSGPRCTPILSGDAVYVLGARGILRKLSLETGAEIWKRDLFEDYECEDGYFGVGSTPLLIDNRILVNVGGKKAGIVAIDSTNGETLWATTREGASYSSPTIFSSSEGDRALFLTRFQLVLIDPKNGASTLLAPFGKRGPTVNAATPLVRDSHIFVTASYGVGASLLELKESEAKTVWSGDDALSSQYNTPILHKGYLYGIHGREDGSAELRCVDWKSGKVAWVDKTFGVANAILIEDILVFVTGQGELVPVEARSDKQVILARSRISGGSTRALPAFANGKLYIRSNFRGDGGMLMCFELSK